MRLTEEEYAQLVQRGLVKGPTRQAEDATLPEGVLQARIRALAQAHGWLFYHTHDSRRSDPGFPDIVLCRPGELIFAELKTATGKLTQEQAVWLDVLGRSVPGVEAHPWRPGDWEAIYTRLTRPQGKEREGCGTPHK